MAHGAYRTAAAYDLDYYGGYDPYYETYADDYDYYGYSGYEDYTGYDDYDYYVPLSYAVSSVPRVRSRGAGLAGMGSRGLRSRSGLVGGRGARGASRGSFGRGLDAATGRGASMPRGVKRKAPTDFGAAAETKKPHTQDAWGTQPIAQQPLSQIGATYSDAEWYQDSFAALDGQEWG